MTTATQPTPLRRSACPAGTTQGGKGGSSAPAADPACPPLLYDWSQATRGDLRQLASAIRRGWAVPSYLPDLAARGALDSGDARRLIAAAWALIAADRANFEAGY